MSLPGRDVLQVTAGILIPGALLYFVAAQIIAYCAGSFAFFKALMTPDTPGSAIILFGAIVLLGYFWVGIASLYEGFVLDGLLKRNWHQGCGSDHLPVNQDDCFDQQWHDYTVRMPHYKSGYISHLVDHFQMELRVGLALSFVGVESGVALYLYQDKFIGQLPMPVAAGFALAVISAGVGGLLLWPGASRLHETLASIRRSMLEADASSRFFAEPEYVGATWNCLINKIGNLKSQASPMAVNLANLLRCEGSSRTRKNIAVALGKIGNGDERIVQALRTAISAEADPAVATALEAALDELCGAGR